MTYKHLSQTERYQIYALMKAGQNLKTIAQILGRHKSTIGREVLRNSGLRGYRPRQADILCQQRAHASRNAYQIDQRTRMLVAERLNLQWSPEQIAASLPVSHETIYQHVYADKASGGVLWKQLRCQKKKRKRYAGGRDRRGQIISRRPIAERPASVETRSQVGHCVDSPVKATTLK
jgi:IS30 family transposase